VILIIIAIAFIAKWCLNKLSFFKSRRTLLYSLSFLIGVSTIIVLALSWNYYIFKIPQENFDETMWINESQNRHKMIDDLVESDYLIGKHVSKIRKVFGKPKNIRPNHNIKIYEIMTPYYLNIKITTLKLFVNDSVVRSFDYKTRVID
ncbi:hypothetical protein, partial [Psychroserpens sp.]|uniref:hypothetical protein n=1 Tax=Psychroserpens sp. TaxID=2020870 RepID=UPI003C747A58